MSEQRIRSGRVYPRRLRMLAAAMATVSVVAISPVRSDPGDIFTVSAPAIGAAPPRAADIADGDASVSSQTGALSYSYPIAVPPGRNGMQPQLALSYSSQAPIYGGIAAGWTLSGLHMISQDTSNGRLHDVRYQSSLAGGRPLIEVNDPTVSGVQKTFRAQNDSSWTRYELLGDSPTQARWRAYTTDGSTWYFGETAHGNCPTFTPTYAPLTRVVDKFGNTVDYHYHQGPQNECRIDFITWGQTTSGLQHFATARFNFAETPSCTTNIPIGSQLSWRTGALVGTGTSRLISIVVVAHAPGAVSPGVLPATPDHRRTITLSYHSATENCATTHAPFRSLASIQESAVGIDSPQVDTPALTFTYGSALVIGRVETYSEGLWTIFEGLGTIFIDTDHGASRVRRTLSRMRYISPQISFIA